MKTTRTLFSRARHSKPAGDRNGSVTVETAIVLPIVFTFMFSAVDCARLNMLRNSAQNAAYEGVRNAITPGAVAADATTAATKVMTAAGAKNYTITVSPTTITSTTNTVTVTITVPLKNNSWLSAVANTSKNLVRSCTLNVEKTRKS
jgi:Flp pilus assembly protein TadG